MTTHYRPVFFVHIMKTGGTSLKQRISMSFPEPELYPNPADDENLIQANTEIDYLRNLSQERRARTKIYAGHFPYVATEILGEPVRTMTLLRDPVDRVISHLKQIRMNKMGWRRFSATLADIDDPPLEAIYADEFLKPLFFIDHQVKMFAATLADNPASYTKMSVEVDRARLEIAKANLSRVDCVGILENYDEFVDEASALFGLVTNDIPPQRVSSDSRPTDAALRELIAEENALDIEFYQFARELCAERSTQKGLVDD